MELQLDNIPGVAFKIIFLFDKAENNAYACNLKDIIFQQCLSKTNFIEEGLLLQYVI